MFNGLLIKRMHYAGLIGRARILKQIDADLRKIIGQDGHLDQSSP